MQYDPAYMGTTFTLGGIVINGATDANGCDWILTKESGWFGSPAIKTARVDKPASRGLFRGNEFRGGRVMTLEGVCGAPTVAALRSAQYALAGVCSDPHQQYPLTVVDETGLSLYASVVLDGEILWTPLGPYSATFSLQLVAPDPRKFATSTTTVTVPLASGGSGGITYPITYPVAYGTAGTPGAVTLVNRGSAEADPYCVLVGPLTNPSLTRADTGDTVTYNSTLAATDTVTIDFGSGAVLLNGVNRRSLLTALQWFSVPGYGSITMLFRSTSVADTGTLTVTYGDASY